MMLNACGSVVADCFDPVAELRFQRACERLHQRGARAVYEVLTAIGPRYLVMTPIEQIVTEVNSVSLDNILAVGADRLSSPPIHLVEGARP